MADYIWRHAHNHCHRVNFDNIAFQGLVRRVVEHTMRYIADRDIGPMISSTAWGSKIRTLAASRHVGLHPGILLGCYNHPQFTPLVQWL
eukprot:5199144-Amphidinium_carterae.1